MATSRLSNKVHINESYKGNFSSNFQLESQKYSFYELTADTTGLIVYLPVNKPDGNDFLKIENAGDYPFYIFDGINFKTTVYPKLSFNFSFINGNWDVDLNLIEELNDDWYADTELGFSDGNNSRTFSDDIRFTPEILQFDDGRTGIIYAENVSDTLRILLVKYNSITKELDVLRDQSLGIAAPGEYKFAACLIEQNNFLVSKGGTISNNHYAFSIDNNNVITVGPQFNNSIGSNGYHTRKSIHIGNNNCMIFCSPLNTGSTYAYVVNVDINTLVVTMLSASETAVNSQNDIEGMQVELFDTNKAIVNGTSTYSVCQFNPGANTITPTTWSFGISYNIAGWGLIANKTRIFYVEQSNAVFNASYARIANINPTTGQPTGVIKTVQVHSSGSTTTPTAPRMFGTDNFVLIYTASSNFWGMRLIRVLSDDIIYNGTEILGPTRSSSVTSPTMATVSDTHVMPFGWNSSLSRWNSSFVFVNNAVENAYKFNFKGIFDDLYSTNIEAENITTQSFTTQSIVTESISSPTSRLDIYDNVFFNDPAIFNDATAQTINAGIISGNRASLVSSVNNATVLRLENLTASVPTLIDGTMSVSTGGYFINCRYNDTSVFNVSSQGTVWVQGNFSANLVTARNSLQIGPAGEVNLRPQVGTGGVPFQFDTELTISGANIFEVDNNGVNKFAIDENGGLYAASDSTIGGDLLFPTAVSRISGDQLQINGISGDGSLSLGNLGNPQTDLAGNNVSITANTRIYGFSPLYDIGHPSVVTAYNLLVDTNDNSVITIGKPSMVSDILLNNDTNVNGNLTANNIYNKRTTIGSTGTNLLVDRWLHGSYRAAKYVLTFSGTEHQTVEFLVVHDGVDTYTTTYAELYSGAAQVFTVSADVVGVNVDVFVNSTLTGAVDITVLRQAI